MLTYPDLHHRLIGILSIQIIRHASLVGVIPIEEKAAGAPLALELNAVVFCPPPSLLDQKPYVKEALHPISLSHVRGEIEFRGISFNYEPGQETLHDINLLVPAGSRLAIIGPYGRRKDYGHWSYCCAFTTLSKDRFCGMFTICANLSSKPCAKTSQLSLTSPVFFMASLRRIFEMETGTRRLRIFMRLHGLPTFTSSFCRFRKAIKRSSEREESGSPRDSDKELQSPERF